MPHTMAMRGRADPTYAMLLPWPARTSGSHKGGRPMRMTSLLAGVLALAPALGSAQTMQDLIENQNSDHVLVHSGGYDRKTYSPLSQIDRRTSSGSCRCGARA